MTLTLTIASIASPPARADDDRVDQLERRVAELEAQRTEEAPTSPASFVDAAANAVREFTLGGYGEMHANLTEGNGGDEFDLHRFVVYLGYEFADWIHLHSETELEHGFVHNGDGEIAIEQLHVDFSISDDFGVRIGRVVTPIGITNRKHEPPSFYGVERPSFDHDIVPSTWTSDGVGVFGRLTRGIRYEAYVTNSLDGSKFTPTEGIREGRMEAGPSLNEPAVSGRVDFFPFVAALSASDHQTLRVGASGFFGGLDNGNHAADPGLDAELWIASGDFQYTIDAVDLRGAVAYEQLSNARSIGAGVASDIFGYTIEAGVHCLPEDWKTGKLAKADCVLFTRFDHIDTQFEVPGGVAKDKAGTRDEVTIGCSWYFTPSLVLKGDVQLRNDRQPGDLPTLINFGLGWEF